MKKIKTNICIIGDKMTECISDSSDKNILDGYSYVCCRVNEEQAYNIHAVDVGNVSYVVIEKGREKVEIRADYYIDATSDISLSRNAGCEHRLLIDAAGKENFKLLNLGEKIEKIGAVSQKVLRSGEFSNLFVAQ